MTRLLATLFGGALTALAATAAQAEPSRLSADAAHTAHQAGELLIVDVRTPQEWRQSGIPEGAVALNMQQKDFVQRLASVMESNPGKRLAFICATGARSGFVATRLNEMGLEGVAEISEGMHGSKAGPGWLARGLPIQPPSADAN